MKKGDLIQTKTKVSGDNDMFGTVLYEIKETGLACNHCNGKDGVKCEMIGGQGQAARKGLVIFDCASHMAKLISSGTASIVDPARRKEMAAFFERQGSGQKQGTCLRCDVQEVTAVICYQVGTGAMLDVCLSAFARHTSPSLCRMLVAYREQDTGFDAEPILRQISDRFDVAVCGIKFTGPDSGSRVHGRLLDSVIPDVQTRYVLTLDSDCFPVADGWLEGLLALVGGDTKVSGILHPWAPPPPWLSDTSIELRIRAQHCWKNTHVACQLIEKDWLKELGVSYNDGDDTGLLIPVRTWLAGKSVRGYLPTRCPKPKTPLDAEFNRDVCIVFGDAVYHHGGYTRKAVFGDRNVMLEPFEWARERAFAERGAEFLLDDELSYRYLFDREEEVAAEKMNRIFGLGKR